MGKEKKVAKKTAEFILRARPQDDPDFNNPNVPQNVLVYVPKDTDNEETQMTLDNIPESIRGEVMDDDTDGKLLREKLGISEEKFNAIRRDGKRKQSERSEDTEKIPELVDCDDEGKIKNLELEDDEELISTNVKKGAKKLDEYNREKEIKFKPSEKSQAKKKEVENLNLDDLLKGNKEKLLEIDDKTLDALMTKSKAKIEADFVEYNEFGLKKDINPEILDYVTNKKFQEGYDLFIPVPNYDQVMEKNKNRVDIDIDPEKMDEDCKEVFDLLKDEEFDDENANEIDDENANAEENKDSNAKIYVANINGGLEDDFILLANEGKLPIEINEKEKKEVKKDENKKDTIPNINMNNKDGPSYKYITKEEKEMLDKKFQKTYEKHYKEKDENEEEFEDFPEDDEEIKNQKKIDINSKEFNEAINQVLPKHKQIEIKKDDEDMEEDEEEEYEDFEEEEEFEDFDENLLKDEFMKKVAESDLKYSEGVQIQEKGKKGKKTKTEILGKKFVVRNKKQEEEDETIEDIEDYLYSKEVLERDVKTINNMIARDEKEEKDKNSDEDPAYELTYAKKYLDITSVGANYGNMPKTVEVEGDIKKHEKKLRREEKIRKEKELKEKQKEILKENEKNKKDKFEKMGKKDKNKLNEFIDKGDDIDSDEDLELGVDKEINFVKDKQNEKEENKLRKKMLKEEKREKRKVKKEIKLAFKDEKNKQSKQIANTNSVIRYGISVKEI